MPPPTLNSEEPEKRNTQIASPLYNKAYRTTRNNTLNAPTPKKQGLKSRATPPLFNTQMPHLPARTPHLTLPPHVGQIRLN